MSKAAAMKVSDLDGAADNEVALAASRVQLLWVELGECPAQGCYGCAAEGQPTRCIRSWHAGGCTHS